MKPIGKGRIKMLCLNCIWFSSGFNDPNGYGYCYSEQTHVDAEGTCAFWQESLRDEPLNDPPGKDKKDA